MSLSEIVALVKEKYENKNTSINLAIFLGAGADFSSGGVSFHEFKRIFCDRYSESKYSKLSPEERIDSDFQKIIEHDIDKSERGYIVEQLFREMGALEPSDAYKLLVLLAVRNVLDIVITTNFDNMLERAEKTLGKNIFQTFGPGLAKPLQLSDSRFRYPKIPYLKLHGDLSARKIATLSKKEIETGSYDKDIILFLESILKNHTIIICGYGGYDKVLAKIIADGINKRRLIFWCNPVKPDEESFLFQELKGHNLKFVKTDFDKLICAIAKPILGPPCCDGEKPVLIRSLMEWRLDYYREEFYKEHLSKKITNCDLNPVPRRDAEIKLRNFLSSNRPLAVIAGKSGMGKSILGINLCNWITRQHGYFFLFIKSRSIDLPVLDAHIAHMLGGLGSEASLTISNLEHWLNKNNLHLIIFLDGLNEYSPEFENCIILFRSIIRFLLQLQPFSPIKLIITVRNITWQRIISYVDQFFLSKLLWGYHNNEKAYSTITLDNFTKEELQEAFNRLKINKKLPSITKALWPNEIERLRDPFIFKTLCNCLDIVTEYPSTLKAFDFALQEKLTKCGMIIHPSVLSSILSNAAYACLLVNNNSFLLKNFIVSEMPTQLEDTLIDLGILIRLSNGYLRFSHDRVHEYFLAKAFGYADAPDLLNIYTLTKYIKQYFSHPVAYTAAKKHFVLNPESIDTLESFISLVYDDKMDIHKDDKEMLFSFIKEVLVEFLEDDPNCLNNLLEDLLHTNRIKNLKSEHLRSLIWIVAHMPQEYGTSLLNNVVRCGDIIASNEANLFLMDKIITSFIININPNINIIKDEPFSKYFNDLEIPAWCRLYRLIIFVSRFGPANLHNDEYLNFWNIANYAFKSFFKTNRFNRNDCKNISKFILTNSNRLFFNATSQEIKKFFNNENKIVFSPIFKHLEKGNVLDWEIYESLLPFVRRIGNNCEFHLSKLAFILSSINDFNATMQLWEEVFNTFNDSSYPEEVDFLQATLPYLFIVNNVDYDNKYDKYFEKILKDWPSVLLHTPGLIRSRWRKTEDEFQLTFEDGFNPIASYIYMQPSRTRKSYMYADYIQKIDSIGCDGKSLIVNYLNLFLQNGEINKALRIIHAIASHIMLWPEEGFSYLQLISENGNPLIRRAYIRILAECYHRFPGLTLKYINHFGSNLTEEEIINIKIRIDPQIGYRQIEDLEWANIANYFIELGIMKGCLYSIIEDFITSDSFEKAVYKLFESLSFIVKD